MMSEPVTQGQFFEAMRQLNDKIDSKHASLRAGFEDHFLRIERSLDDHTREDRLVADRVLTIENDRRSGNERRKEDQQRADRRTGVISTAISLFWAGILFALGLLFKK